MNANPANILVAAEDNELRATLVSALEQQGHLVIECATQQEAMTAATEQSPDVIIADLTGVDFRQDLKALSEARPGAVLILIEHGGEYQPVRELPADHVFTYLTKPLDMAQVRAAIHNAVKLRALSAENDQLAKSLRETDEGLKSEVARRKFADEARQTTVRRLELAYDNITLHAQELREEMGHRKRAEEALARSEELRRLQAARDAREQERKHLAEELHDETMAELTSLAMDLGLLRQTTGSEAELKDGMRELRDRVRKAEVRLRQIVQGIFPSVLTNLGLVPALRSHLEELAARLIDNPTPLDVELKATGFDEGRLPEEVEIATYRFIQQGMTNTIQHARATRLVVDLDWSDSNLSFSVSDDGVGFDVDDLESTLASGHFGLLTLRDRIEGLHGTFEIESRPSAGTTVRATVPIDSRTYQSQEVQTATFVLDVQGPQRSA